MVRRFDFRLRNGLNPCIGYGLKVVFLAHPLRVPPRL